MNVSFRPAFGLLAALVLTGAASAGLPDAFPPETGVASWYGEAFHGKKTANGESFDMRAMTAAHRKLPFGTFVTVTNLADGRSVVVRINDRGPFVAGRIIDLSKAAAMAIGLDRTGTALVEVRQAPAGSAVGPFPAPGRVSAFPDSAMQAGTQTVAPGVATIVARIQVGSYRDAAHARTAIESLALLGFAAVIEVAQPYHRVVIYVSRADRAAAEAKLDGAGWTDALVTEVSR